MPYDPLDDVPHSVRLNLSGSAQPMDDGNLHPRTPQRSMHNPYPLHFSPVTDGSPDVHQHQHTPAPISSTWSIGHTAHPHNLLSHNQQVMSPNAQPGASADQAAEASTNFGTSYVQATFMQAVRLDVPTAVLQQFAQASALDSSLLDDLRAAVVELHDRMHYRTNVLGGVATTLHQGYNSMLESLERVQQGIEAHTRVIETVIRENQAMRAELEATRTQLAEAKAEAQAAKMGPQQWQAQIEAHLIKIESELEAHVKQQLLHLDATWTKRMDQLEKATAERLAEVEMVAVNGPVDESRLRSLEGAQGEQSEKVAHLLGRVGELEGSVKDHDQALARNLDALQQVEIRHDRLVEEVALLQGVCEHFHLDPDVGRQSQEEWKAEVDTYEADWWGQCQAADGPKANPPQTQTPEAPEKPPGLLEVKQSVTSSTPASSADKIHHGRWKLLQDAPVLILGSGEPWEQGMRLRTWIKQVETISGTIAESFGAYVKRQFHLAESRHQQRLAGVHNLEALPEVSHADSEHENRLVLLLIRCVPAELKQSVLEKNDEAEPLRSVSLVEGVLETLQPGGAAEMQSLHGFARSLQPASTARDALSTLRRWRLARTRSASLNLPQVAPYEELQALSTLVKILERRHDRFRTMLGLLRTRPEIIRPTPVGVEEMVNLLEQQLQLISADEHVRTNRQGDSDPQAAKGKGKGKASSEGSASKPCPFLKKFGKCRFGDRCYFKHEGVRPDAAATPKAAPNAKAPPSTPNSEVKQICEAFKKSGTCRFGDRCKYEHVGEAKAAATPKPKAQPKPKPKAARRRLRRRLWLEQSLRLLRRGRRQVLPEP